MTPQSAAEFVDRYVAARAAGHGAALQALWRPDGVLHYPFTDRLIPGDRIADLVDRTRAAQPLLSWTMTGWTHRDDVVVIEWRCTNPYGPHVLSWTGVDKFTLVDGRIAEEVVYCDTAPLHALRRGETFEPLMRLD